MTEQEIIQQAEDIVSRATADGRAHFTVADVYTSVYLPKGSEDAAYLEALKEQDPAAYDTLLWKIGRAAAERVSSQIGLHLTPGCRASAYPWQGGISVTADYDLCSRRLLAQTEHVFTFEIGEAELDVDGFTLKMYGTAPGPGAGSKNCTKPDKV